MVTGLNLKGRPPRVLQTSGLKMRVNQCLCYADWKVSSLALAVFLVRICHCEGDDESPLITPCRCTGTLRFVHQACLHQWIKSSDTRCCELCKYDFIMETKLKPLRKVCCFCINYTVVPAGWNGCTKYQQFKEMSKMSLYSLLLNPSQRFCCYCRCWLIR